MLVFNEKRSQAPIILIVDDSVTNIKLLSEAVIGMGEVLFATDGAGAVNIARQRKPDVILLDIEMPGMDGYAVCESLKADPTTAECSIIFVTAHDSDQHEVQSLTRGGVDFLQKPLNIPVARARVQTQLTLKRQTRDIVQARRDLADLMRHLPALVAYWDEDLRNRFSNDSAGRWFGVTANAMCGMHVRDVIGQSAYASIQPYLSTVLAGDDVTFECVLPDERGAVRYAMVALVASRQQAGDGFLMLVTDITERKHSETALYQEKERMRVMLDSIADAVIATDSDGHVVFLNPIAEEMTGWMSKDAIGAPIEVVMPLHEKTTDTVLENPVRLALRETHVVSTSSDCWLCGRGGREFGIEHAAAPIRDPSGNLSGVIVVFRDVSEVQATAIRMTHLAQHDALTDLPNRILLNDRVDQALQLAHRNNMRVAMLILDIDHFKFINDAVGHSTGDALLRQLSIRLRQTLLPTDTLSRQGGDEFIVLLPELESIERVGQVAQRLLDNVMTPMAVEDSTFNLTASVGISIYPDDAEDQEALMRHADSAMYRAKQEGRGRCRFFSSDIEEILLSRHLLERHLREAIDRKQLEVFYQAKVDADTDAIVGVEALLRWRNDEGELISPARFIPLAEECGLIIPIGKFVLMKACQQACAWHEEGHKVRVCVNISAVQFVEEGFPGVVAEVLNQTGIVPEALELEITEGVLMHDVERTRNTLSALKALGVSIAVDDFGTGYSSLAYLKRFPVDVLKIDQSFVRDMQTDSSDAAIIAAIINLGHSLGLELVAEGVEQADQVTALIGLGCHIMQGFLYSRPCPAALMTTLLHTGIQTTGR
ncbi:EAL domain-containing protein [Chitinivorax sp. B]|uniref:GGDEF/EAL domain-containing response regulator n=1 Tax=Chitinivorax sp. B TaxID=2502235 RepID=UPI0010F8DF0E|nr:EAL domain-containing protein [Chitinivorax sp. B]